MVLSCPRQPLHWQNGCLGHNKRRTMDLFRPRAVDILFSNASMHNSSTEPADRFSALAVCGTVQPSPVRAPFCEPTFECVMQHVTHLTFMLKFCAALWPYCVADFAVGRHSVGASGTHR